MCLAGSPVNSATLGFRVNLSSCWRGKGKERVTRTQ